MYQLLERKTKKTTLVPTQIPNDQPNSFKTEGEIALNTGIFF
jgi:hypothetical protein